MSQAELPDAIFLLISSHKHSRFSRCQLHDGQMQWFASFFRVYLQ